MAVVRQRVTADELLHIPDNEFRSKLVRGELRRTTPAGNVHGRVAMGFAWRLARYVDENRLGTVYAAETGFWPEAPDLAVEVVSPDDSYAAVEEKVFDWLDAGTKMVVVNQPPSTIGDRAQVTDRHHRPPRGRCLG